ncbi:MAG: radical SAM protein [Nanoarchaeota archaeon]|nr:radical SAM protein [Nanoarchaeota archaeon]
MTIEKMLMHNVQTVRKDLVWQFGDSSDGVIEFAGIVDKGYIEVGYLYGDAKPKNIIVISTQVGCPSKCHFCDLGSQPFVRNLYPQEMYDQVALMLQQAMKYGIDVPKSKHKINYAKSGEPLFNPHFVEGLETLSELDFTYKIATIFPSGQQPMARFQNLARFASNYTAPTQIQISLISTSEEYRQNSIGTPLASFKELRKAADYWKTQNPNGRKINLSLIMTEDVSVNIDEISDIFPSELFRFRFRNYVETEHGLSQGLETITQNRFDVLAKQFQDRGYEVGTWATPSPVEQRFGLASNVSLRRYQKIINGDI